jgi:hypothetical protein
VGGSGCSRVGKGVQLGIWGAGDQEHLQTLHHMTGVRPEWRPGVPGMKGIWGPHPVAYAFRASSPELGAPMLEPCSPPFKFLPLCPWQ